MPSERAAYGLAETCWRLLARPRAAGHTLAFSVTLLATSVAFGDDSVCTDGRIVTGTLAFAEGRLLFRVKDGAVVPGTQIEQIRFPPVAGPPIRTAATRRILLADGQAVCWACRSSPTLMPYVSRRPYG